MLPYSCYSVLMMYNSEAKKKGASNMSYKSLRVSSTIVIMSFFYGIFVSSFLYFNKKNSLLVLFQCPRQPTNFECGFYVMRYMRELVSHSNPEQYVKSNVNDIIVTPFFYARLKFNKF